MKFNEIQYMGLRSQKWNGLEHASSGIPTVVIAVICIPWLLSSPLNDLPGCSDLEVQPELATSSKYGLFVFGKVPQPINKHAFIEVSLRLSFLLKVFHLKSQLVWVHSFTEELKKQLSAKFVFSRWEERNRKAAKA